VCPATSGQKAFWQACVGKDYDANAAASTAFALPATLASAIAQAEVLRPASRPLRVLILGASERNEYAGPLHALIGVNSLGDLLTATALAATEFEIVGPQVPTSISGSTERLGDHIVSHTRARLHELARPPFDGTPELCIAFHPGFGIPRYRAEWRPTLNLLADSGTIIFATAYDDVENAANLLAIEESAKHAGGLAQVLFSGPCDTGALQGVPGMGKLHYAVTIAILPGRLHRQCKHNAPHQTSPDSHKHAISCVSHMASIVQAH
jgi:hypothetical protein